MEKLSGKKNIDALSTSTKVMRAVGGNPVIEYQTDVRSCKFDLNLGQCSPSHRGTGD